MTLFLVLAGGTGVIVVDIAAMVPAVVRVGVEIGFPVFIFFLFLCWVLEETFLRALLIPLMEDKRDELATEAVSAGTSGGGRHCCWSW